MQIGFVYSATTGLKTEAQVPVPVCVEIVALRLTRALPGVRNELSGSTRLNSEGSEFHRVIVHYSKDSDPSRFQVINNIGQFFDGLLKTVTITGLDTGT